MNYFVCVVLVVLVSYFLGSVNFAVLISKLFYKKEIRNLGSGNAGATNMLRSFGGKSAFFTFLGDFLKGYFSVYLSGVFVFLFLENLNKINICFEVEFKMISLIFVVCGHIFPVFYKFRGGKGISTAAGAVLAIDVKIFFMVILFFFILIVFSRIVSLSSVCTVIFFVVVNSIYWFEPFHVLSSFSSVSSHNFYPLIMWVFVVLESIFLASIIVFKHKLNIKRIFQKTEPKIGR